MHDAIQVCLYLLFPSRIWLDSVHPAVFGKIYDPRFAWTALWRMFALLPFHFVFLVPICRGTSKTDSHPENVAGLAYIQSNRNARNAAYIASDIFCHSCLCKGTEMNRIVKWPRVAPTSWPLFHSFCKASAYWKNSGWMLHEVLLAVHRNIQSV